MKHYGCLEFPVIVKVLFFVPVIFPYTRTVILFSDNFSSEYFSFLNERVLMGICLKKKEASLICVENIIVYVVLSNFWPLCHLAYPEYIYCWHFFSFTTYLVKCSAVMCFKSIFPTIGTNKIFMPKQLGMLFVLPCHEHWTIVWTFILLWCLNHFSNASSRSSLSGSLIRNILTILFKGT